MRKSLYAEGRRLPALVPLRELHHAHPLHRGRPRAGDHRAAQPALREHPRHRSRPAHAPAAQPARRHQPALAVGAARRRRRGARPGGGVPGHQRRRRARRHAARRARPLPRAGIGRRRAARRERPHDRARDAAAHARRGRARARHRRGSGRRATAPRSAAGSCSRPTSTTCSPVARSPTLDRLRRASQHENGIGMAAQLRRRGARRARRRRPSDGASARAPGFFAWVDGAPAEGYRARRAPRSHLRPCRCPLRSQLRRSRAGAAVTIVTGEYGAQVLEPLRRRPRDRGRAVDVSLLAVDNQFFGGNIAVTGLLTGADVARALDAVAAHERCAYLCPTSCSPTGASSTAPRPPICPDRSRSSPPTARRSSPRCAERPGAGTRWQRVAQVQPAERHESGQA